MFSTTPIYAIAISVIYLILWVRVASRRASEGISIGSGTDLELLLRIRQHGNCAEWSCFVLILMLVAEGMGVAGLYLDISGSLLVLGRIAHPFGLKVENAAHGLRYVGNGTNILATLTLLFCCIVNLLGL